MEGVARRAKQVLGPLAVVALLLGLKYAHCWVFRSVEDSDPWRGQILDEFARAAQSLSPARTQPDGATAVWSIAVATNRIEAPNSDFHEVGVSGRKKSLWEQTLDHLFATPPTAFGFSEARVPLNRPRGKCSLEGGTDGIAVQALQPRQADEFYAQLRSLMRASKAKDVFIFVHGFNVSLEESIARAAQMAEDMPFHGLVVAFSWPSQARTRAYLDDEQIAERYFWNLADLLAGLRRGIDEDVRLHVLAHSMGNRVALRALNALAGTIGPTGREADPFAAAGEEIRRRFPAWGSWRSPALATPALANLILAAPDVDAGEFTGFVRNIRHVSQSILLYASDTDLALEASRKVHGGAFRAGDSRATIPVQALQTIRVSGVDALDPLGHSYYGANATVLTQLARRLRPPVRLIPARSASE